MASAEIAKNAGEFTQQDQWWSNSERFFHNTLKVWLCRYYKIYKYRWTLWMGGILQC